MADQDGCCGICQGAFADGHPTRIDRAADGRVRGAAVRPMQSQSHSQAGDHWMLDGRLPTVTLPARVRSFPQFMMIRADPLPRNPGGKILKPRTCCR